MRKSGLSLAVALLVCGGSAFAQEDMNTTKVDEITVVSATGFEQNIVDAPASISVVTSEEIQKASYVNIKDVLKNVGGIDVRSYKDLGDNDISIRGMDPKYTLIMINGKSVSGREVGGVFRDGINIQTLPPLNMIERIEVIRGPMSSLYGSEAVGGMVNIITKKVSNEWNGSFSSQYNIFQNRNFGDNWNTGIYVAGPIVENFLGIELNGLLSQKNEDKKQGNQNSKDVLEGENKSRNLGGKLSWLMTDRDTLSLEYQYSKNNVLHHMDKSDWDKKGDYKKDVITLDYEGKYDKLTLQSYLKYDKSSYFGILTENSDFKIGGDLKTLIFNAQGSYNFDRHILTLGLNFLNEEIKELFTDKSKRWNMAIFGEDDYFITDNLTLTLGARLNKNERYGTHFSPRVYTVYHLNDYFTIKGGISTGYINPELTQSAKGGFKEYGRGSVLTLGNPEIKPENSINYEAGLVYGDEKTNLSLMLFYSDFKDKIGSINVCEDGDTGNATTWTCDFNGKKYWSIEKAGNLEALYNAGVELTFDYQILSNLNLRSNYTYVKSKYKKGEEKGQLAKQMPEHTVNVGFDYNPIDKINLWAKISYKSKEKNRIFRKVITLYGKPSYTLVDLGLVYKINENLSINAGVYNLLNKNAEYLTNSTVWGENYKFLEERKFMLGFNANF